MAQATQMNFRIDSALKADGDLTLREGGVSPSCLVRSVWEYLKRNRHASHAVERLMAFLETDGASVCAPSDQVTAADEAEKLVMAGPDIVAEFYNRIDLSPESVEPCSFEEMKLDAYADKYPILHR